MKLFTSLFLLPALTLAVPSGHSKKCCLCDSDVTAILKDWTAFYETNDAAQVKPLADKIIAEDFQALDETFMKAPIAQGTQFVGVANKTDLINQSVFRITSLPDAAPNRKFRNVHTIHTCDTIVFRWEYDSTIEKDNLAGLPINQTLAPIGTKIQYKGIDIIQMDSHCKLIEKVWTSQDWYNQLKNFGFVDWAN